MNVLPGDLSGLSVAEKFELLDALWQDIEAQIPVIGPEQAAELDRRVLQYEQDRSAVVPWEQVRAGLLRP